MQVYSLSLYFALACRRCGHVAFCFFLEVLILFEQWAGHRLLSEKVTRPHVRADRSMLIPSVLVSEGIEIRHG